MENKGSRVESCFKIEELPSNLRRDPFGDGGGGATPGQQACTGRSQNLERAAPEVSLGSIQHDPSQFFDMSMNRQPFLPASRRYAVLSLSPYFVQIPVRPSMTFLLTCWYEGVHFAVCRRPHSSVGAVGESRRARLLQPKWDKSQCWSSRCR